MNINLKFLLLGTSLSLIPQYAAAQCAETDCLKLGYTKLEKCDNGLKCPFGEYWACPKTEEKAVLGQCTGYAKNCTIGQILNSDGTCTTDKESGKTPIGVVIAIKDNCGWAMTVSPVQKNIDWTITYVTPGSLKRMIYGQAIDDFDSCVNTQKIIQFGDAYKYPAAWAAFNYKPNTAPETNGMWCLPAAGVLHSLYNNLKVVNNTISRLNGIQINEENRYIWSSTICNAHSAWFFQIYGYGGLSSECNGDHTIGGNGAVRPVISF